MKIKVNSFEIEISERGIVTFIDKNNKICLGSSKGNRFDISLQALKSAKELGYLCDLEDEQRESERRREKWK